MSSRLDVTSARQPQEDDGEPFTEKMTRLADQWREQQAEAARLDVAIEANLRGLGVVPSASETEPTR